MARFYVAKDGINEDIITIRGNDVSHIKNVLRLAPGEEIVVCDGLATDYTAVIEAMGNSAVTARIKTARRNTNESPVSVYLFQGLPKSDKMDLIIQKCTELGISKIFPVITNRTIIKINNRSDEFKKLERWNRISLEASKQSCRGLVPSVEEVLSFENAIEKAAAISDLAILAYENEEKAKLKEILQNSHARIISIFVGPEGGFEKDEVNAAIKRGILPVKLGPRILRTETAGFAMLTAIMYELGDIG